MLLKSLDIEDKNINFLYNKARLKTQNTYHISNNLFNQNIKDHKLLLLEYSTEFIISSQMQSIYIYRDELFCIKKLGLDSEWIWIIKYINDIPDHRSLLEYDSIKIPSKDFLNDLVDKCKILQSKINTSS